MLIWLSSNTSSLMKGGMGSLGRHPASPELDAVGGSYRQLRCHVVRSSISSWWRHQMETFSALLALCAWNSPVNGEFPSERPVTRSFDIFFRLCPNKWLSKQSWGWWFETRISYLHFKKIHYGTVSLIALWIYYEPHIRILMEEKDHWNCF